MYYTIPDSVTGIGNYAFRNSKIVYLTIPNHVVSMDSDAFYKCTYLKSVSFGSGLSAIGSFAFYDCTALESVSIPENITVIENYAFNSCSSLNSITIPDSVTSIGKFAFHYTGYYNDRTNWEENVLYIDNHLITANESLNGVYTVKTGTKTIAKMTFTRCYDLLSICFPKSIVNIGEEAFNNCTLLDEVWYLGTEADKENIEIGSENSPLVMADWYFGSNAEVTNLKVTNISGGIRLSWDTLGNATRYLIYRKTLYSFGWSGYEFLSDSYSESYTDNDVESGVHVQYLVVAYVGRISMDGGTVVDTMYLLQPSATIKNVANGVNLSWNTVSGATQYKVYRSTYSGGKWSEYKLFAKPTTTYYTDKTAKSGVNYSYKIYACNGSYKSNGSFPVSITYLAKPSVKLTNAKTGVYLSWSKISGAKGYKVYRSTYSGGKWSEYKLFAKPTTTYYTDKTAKSGIKYRYIVYSAKGKVESYESSSVTSIYLSPRTPKVSKASTGIKISWTKVTGAKGYTVYRRAYSGGKWSELKAMYKTTKLTVTDKTAKKGVKYQYVVRAYNGDYKSAVKYSSTIKR